MWTTRPPLRTRTPLTRKEPCKPAQTPKQKHDLEESRSWHPNSLIECSEGYTEFDDEFIRQIIQKITVEDADTIRIQFRDSDVVLEQGLQ